MSIWLLTAALLSTPSQCPTGDISATAQHILRGLQAKDFHCIRKMLVHPEEWFEGGTPNFLDDMSFKSESGRRLNDILNEHGAIAVAETERDKGAIFLIDKTYYGLFLKNKSDFLKRYKYEGYRSCPIQRINGAWMLTGDFCYMESD